jgi:hypothetical protein
MSLLEQAPAPGLADRLLGSAYYFGMAPLVRLCCRPAANPFLRHHYAQAMAALFLAQILTLLVVLLTIALTFITVTYPAFARRFAAWGSLDLIILEFAPWIAIGWGVLWAFLVVLVLAGSSWTVPLLGRWARRPALVQFAFVGNWLALLLVPLTTALAWHASSLTRTNGDGAAVYLLYDEAIGVPRWVYALGLYRVSLQARQQWGPDSVVLDRLNANTLRTALANGQVVILASHGKRGDVITPNLGVAPPTLGATSEQHESCFLWCWGAGVNETGTVEAIPVNRRLRLVYVSGCDSGQKAEEWEEHLSPAKVITFNRLSAPLEHLWWLLTAAPQEIGNLEPSHAPNGRLLSEPGGLRRRPPWRRAD